MRFLVTVHRPTTERTLDLTILGPTVAELRVRADVLNKVLAELVGRTVPADSEVAGMLGLAHEHAEAIAGAPEESDTD